MATWFIDAPQRLSLDGDATNGNDISQLDVWLAQGRLRVVGTDGPPRVEVTKIGHKGVTVSVADGVLSVRHERKQGWWPWAVPFWWLLVGRRAFYADVSIAVPPTTAVRLAVVSGSIIASGLRRGASVEVTSGHITVMGLFGAVRAKTISGSIEAVGVGGDLSMQTVSGDISLADGSAERVFARTISGSVTCDLDNPFARDVHVDTTSGEITLRVPQDADLTVNLSAMSGRVTSAFPQVLPHNLPGHRSASGRLGAGSGTLTARAVSGSVSLLASPTEHFSDSTEDGSTPDGSTEDGGETR